MNWHMYISEFQQISLFANDVSQKERLNNQAAQQFSRALLSTIVVPNNQFNLAAIFATVVEVHRSLRFFHLQLNVGTAVDNKPAILIRRSNKVDSAVDSSYLKH